MWHEDVYKPSLRMPLSTFVFPKEAIARAIRIACIAYSKRANRLDFVAQMGRNRALLLAISSDSFGYGKLFGL